jgi:hypothetical protein
MQPIPRKIEGLWSGGLIEAKKNVLDQFQQIGAYPSAFAMLIKPPEATVFKAPDHQGSVMIVAIVTCRRLRKRRGPVPDPQ